MEVSVLIPCHNEERVLEQSYERVRKVMDGTGEDYEIIIEQDGSTDETPKIMKRIEEDFRVRILSYEEKKGLGWAWRKLFSKAKGTKIIMTDADMSVSPKIFPTLLKELEDGDVVIASRYVGAEKKLPLRRWVASRAYYLINKLLFGINVKDSQSGFQAFRKEVVDSVKLKSTGFEINLELLVKAKRKGFRIKEIPARYEHRKDSRFSVLRHGPKTLIKTLKLFKECTFDETTD